jgi:diketogulonate reductase-like aldo/keto reductase
MIGGHATPETTKVHARKHHPLAYNSMAATQLTVSQAGFGCYRVSAGVSHHEQALSKALCEGINLIDTSANYADGGSETLVGMRRKTYVSDVMTELQLQIEHKSRLGSWQKLTEELAMVP